MHIDHPIKPVLNSFIGWLGGKTKLRPTIINCIPSHMCYVEVFAGSATVFFGKPSRMSRIEVLNDVHTELIILMKVLAGATFEDRETCPMCKCHLDSEEVRQEFIGYVRSMPAARAAYEEWKKWKGKDLEKLNPAQRAFRFYYCVKKGFSSVPKGGYEASPMTNSRYNMNTNFDKFTKRFRERNAQIESMDFADLIKKYNRESGDTFFFADPPYWIANNTNYYDFVFTEEDHMRLRDSCDLVNENKNKFLITYDDVPEIEKLYKDYYIYRTDEIVYNAADERGERDLIKKELFISNYDISKMLFEKKTDIFAEFDIDDKRIDIHGHIGLERVN